MPIAECMKHSKFKSKDGYAFIFVPQDWSNCVRASNRLADLMCAIYHPGDAETRKVATTATFAEIIAEDMGIHVPEVSA